MSTQPGTGTSSLIEQERALVQAKADQIKALLDERVKLAEDTQRRLGEIADELKALGWHRSKTAKAMTNGAGEKK